MREDGPQTNSDGSSGSDDSSLKTSVTLINDAKLMKPEAWVKIVKLYSPLIDFWSRQRGIRQKPDLDNMRQEVFMKVARYIDSFQKRSHKGAFRGWLKAITRTTLASKYDKAGEAAIGGSVGFEILNNVAAENSVSLFDSLSSVRTPESTIMYRRIMGWIKQSFSDQQIGVFSSLVVDERKPRDIAEDLGISLNSVYHTKSRILKRVREEFGEYV